MSEDVECLAHVKPQKIGEHWSNGRMPEPTHEPTLEHMPAPMAQPMSRPTPEPTQYYIDHWDVSLWIESWSLPKDMEPSQGNIISYIAKRMWMNRTYSRLKPHHCTRIETDNDKATITTGL